MEIKIEIKLDSGKKIRLSESEYEELKQKFEKTVSIPYLYPEYPNYPVQPQPSYRYYIT